MTYRTNAREDEPVKMEQVKRKPMSKNTRYLLHTAGLLVATFVLGNISYSLSHTYVQISVNTGIVAVLTGIASFIYPLVRCSP